MVGDSNDRELTREFDPETTTPTRAVVEAVADLEDVDALELPPLYATMNDLLDRVASAPPEPSANVEITFTYEGYRISVHQNGQVTVAAT